jgi:lipoprotein-anchoring transpeptidase ErfK/SrfK
VIGFDDNTGQLNHGVSGAGWRFADAKTVDRKCTMPSLKVKLAVLAAGLLLSGCMQSATYEATNTTAFKPRDKEYLAKIRYTNVPVAEPFRRAIVDYHRKEAPGSIVVDSDNHYLY